MLELPRRPERLQEEPEAAADERCGRPARRDRAHVRVVGVARNLSRDLAAEHCEQPVAREVGRVLGADAHQAVAVEGGESGSLPDRHVQRRDVGVADERLRARRDEVEVEVRDHLARAEAALEGLDDVDLRVGEEGVEVVGTAAGVAGDIVVPCVDARRELDPVAAALPPLDAALDLGAHVVRAGERADADRAAVLERSHLRVCTPVRNSRTSSPIVARS